MSGFFHPLPPPPPPPPLLEAMEEDLPPPPLMPPPPTEEYPLGATTSSGRASFRSFPLPTDESTSGRSSSALSGSISRSRERRRERKEEGSEKNSEKRKGDKLKAGSLGELVREAKKSKLEPLVEEKAPEAMEVDEASLSDDLNEEILKAQAKPSPDAELPRLTAEDLREPVIMNPDPSFDPETMRVKTRTPIAQEVLKEDSYVTSDGCSYSTNSARGVEALFRASVLDFLNEAKAQQENPPRPPTPPMHDRCKCGGDDDGESEETEPEDDDETETDITKMSSKRRNKELMRREVERKQNHPSALSPDICFNEPGMSNDGPICRCSVRTRSEGIRHNVFVGEERILLCNPLSNNADRLYHYVLQVNGAVNKPTDKTTQIRVGKDIFDFKGFSLFFHRPLPAMFPKTPISRWNTDIEFEFVQEPVPECFTVGETEAFYSYLVEHVLDLFDLPRFPFGGSKEGCPVFHAMPRFMGYSDGKPSLLPMTKVLQHFSSVFKPVFQPGEAEQKMKCSDDEWYRFSQQGKSQLLLNPGKRPSALRVDSYTRNTPSGYPHFVQNTVRPVAYMSLHTAEQYLAQKQLNKLKKLQKMRKSPTPSEQRELGLLQKKIDDMKAYNSSIRNVSVIFSMEPFYRTGFFADVVSHVLTVSLACHHARLHMSFEKLEEKIDFRFANRSLLELAMTHPSFKLNYGMNSDHAKNTLLNCGYKRKFNTDKFEDLKRIGGGPRMAERIVSGGLKTKTIQVVHNERLEYLGDAVVEMIVTNRLFFILSHHQEGPLATYRSAMVQNRNLAALAKNIGLHNWLLFTHGPDLCHEADFRHALANAFEAIMGAIYLDHSAEPADRIFSQAMFGDDPETKQRWDVISEHELKTDLPDGDRHMIAEVPNLQMLTELEDRIGLEFKHIRVLAKAFTRRSVPWNELTRGHNQRLEWLGDTVLQLIVSDYLYRHFPYHHEGNLSLLRTCIVSNKTQAAICDEVGLCEFVIKHGRSSSEGELKMKDKADLVESLLGAIFVDRGWEYCKSFIKVMFLPRLKYFLVENRWADDKSKLQQACLSLRSPDSKSQEVPIYRILSSAGPTNSRMYRVGVYFRDTRLAIGIAPTVHLAEMDAAKKALVECQELLPDGDKERQTRRQRSRHAARVPSRPLASIPSLFSTPFLPPPNIAPSSVNAYPSFMTPYRGQPTPLLGQLYPQPPQPLFKKQ